MKTNLDWLPVTVQRAHPEIVQDGCHIARLDGVNLQGLNHAQSAAHIVRCVNSHDRLVAALVEIHKIATQDLRDALHSESVNVNDFEAQLRHVRGIVMSIAAIAAAEKGQP